MYFVAGVKVVSRQDHRPRLRYVNVLSSSTTAIVLLDRQLNISVYVKSCVSIGVWLRTDLSKALSVEAANTVLRVFVSSRLNYCNSLLFGISDSLSRRLLDIGPT